MSIQFLLRQIRRRMEEIDELVDILEEELGIKEEPLGIPTVPVGPICPECSTEFSDTNDISTMGNHGAYACPNCSFRGTV